MARNTKRTVFESQETEINYSTGEITKFSSNKVVALPAEPPYVKMYIHDLSTILSIPKAEEELLRLLLRKLDFDGYISLTTRYRKILCERLGLAGKNPDQQLRNKISKLVKSGAIVNTGYGEYMANPEYFARGSWAQICENKKSFEMRITYSENGRKITTEAVEEQGELPLS